MRACVRASVRDAKAEARSPRGEDTIAEKCFVKCPSRTRIIFRMLYASFGRVLLIVFFFIKSHIDLFAHPHGWNVAVCVLNNVFFPAV